jgi:hypothetical protein
MERRFYPALSLTTFFWGLVARLPSGRTQWRRIYLQPNTALPIGVADETVNFRRHPLKGSEMKRADVFPDKYLKAADLKGKARVLEIDQAPLETLKNTKGEEQQKIVLYFVGAKKALPLNMTNFDAVADICGDDTDSWPGQEIELYPTRTQMGSQTVDCVRVRKPQELPTPPPAKREVPPSDFDDDIPF